MGEVLFSKAITSVDRHTYEVTNFTGDSNSLSRMTITGNNTDNASFAKTSGGSSWDTQIYSLTAFTAPCTIEFNKDAGTTDNSQSYAMVGWNEDPTSNASYTSIDYAAYPFQQNSYNVYHNGSEVLSGGPSWSSSQKFYIVYGTDGTIKHYNGSTLLYNVNYGTGKTVYFDSSYYSVNATTSRFYNVRLSRDWAWNGTEYVR